jgi:hypothetical protein
MPCQIWRKKLVARDPGAGGLGFYLMGKLVLQDKGILIGWKAM